MVTNADIKWFKETFGQEITDKFDGTGFTLDLLTAIACQETGIIWTKLRKDGVTRDRILELCVGDTVDVRSAFPASRGPAKKGRAALEKATNGKKLFRIARKSLEDVAVHNIPGSGFERAVRNSNEFCHGFGMFQVDIQHFKTDPNYFLQKQWADMEKMLDRVEKILKRSLKIVKNKGGIPSSKNDSFTRRQLAFIAIAYNTGNNFKVSRKLKQGHKDGQGVFYGEHIDNFIKKSEAIDDDVFEPVSDPMPENLGAHTVAKAGLTLHKFPGTGFETLETLDFGTTVFVLERDMNGAEEWAEVSLDNDGTPDGFVLAEDLLIIGDEADTGEFTVVASPDIKVHKHPGTGFEIVKTLDFGTTVFVLERDMNGAEEWAEVSLDNDGSSIGYVLANDLTAAMGSNGNQFGEFEVNVNTDLKLRKHPGATFEIVETLFDDTRVFVLDRTMNGNEEWAEVSLDDDGVADGFVASRFLKAVGGSSSKLRLDPIQIGTVVKTDDLKFREVPEGRIIRSLTMGDAVNVISDAGRGWKNVEIDGEKGVVFGSLLRPTAAPSKEMLIQKAIFEWVGFGKAVNGGRRGFSETSSRKFRNTDRKIFEHIGDMFDLVRFEEIAGTGDNFDTFPPRSTSRRMGDDNIDGRDTKVAWSAACISWIVNASGNEYDDFFLSFRHSEFSNDAINAKIMKRRNKPFWGFEIEEKKPELGDIIHISRGSNRTFDFAKNNSKFTSHSDIVVEVNDRSVVTIGGNVGNSVSTSEYQLNSNGFLKPKRRGNRLIALLKNRSDEIS